jgi:hypothetical protein
MSSNNSNLEGDLGEGGGQGGRVLPLEKDPCNAPTTLNMCTYTIC